MASRVTARLRRHRSRRRQRIGWVAVAWRRAAGYPLAATASIAGICLASILLITAVAGVHEPEIHDELAQLVQADIFVHGRLAERPHPFWQHFETFHVLSQPTYQSKFPPGPPLFIAFGQALTGEPITGVWLTVVVMICAMAYAMYAWLPPRWAILGTALVALRFGIVGGWSSSYWGGACAAAGGGLVLGAIGRLIRGPTVRDGALFGTGLVLLAYSRPYEGLAYSLPLLAIFGWHLLKPWPERRRLWRASLPAALCISMAGIAWLAYYDWRVTGSALTMPHMAYEQAYSAAPLFILQKPRVPAPVFRHREMANFERTFEMPSALRAQQLWPWDEIAKFGGAVIDFLKPTLLIACFGFRYARQRLLAAGAIPAACVGTLCLAMLLSLWSATRYAAPATASIFILASIGLSGLSRIRLRKPEWLDRRWIPVVAVVLFAAAVPVAAALYVVDTRTSTEWWADKRAIRERLLGAEGNDLVFVRYSERHVVHREWVYNGADIDSQPIVWAREINPESDAALRAYFGSRHAWIVFADEKPARLVEWRPDGL